MLYFDKMLCFHQTNIHQNNIDKLAACLPLSQRSGPGADECVGRWAPAPATAGTWGR